jgi:hypothetical protein
MLILAAAGTLHAQDKKPPTLESILLEQLRTTHNVKDWFVPVNICAGRRYSRTGKMD